VEAAGGEDDEGDGEENVDFGGNAMSERVEGWESWGGRGRVGG
jgi:hypothetical protein